MDFFTIQVREIERGPKKGEFEAFPDFKVGRSKDLMIRGKSFYAIWDEEAGLWSKDEYDVQRLVDAELEKFVEERRSSGVAITPKYLRSFGNNGWSQFQKYIKNISDNSHPLDQTVTFANSETRKTDYASHRLPYSLEDGDHSAWDELVGTLYNIEERAKIEWAIGAILSGDAKKIQKFLVFYGAPGTGKGTVLDIVMKLLAGYYATFDAKALGSAGAAFATEVFKHNPLVAIQHDGDLSRIEDNARLNSIISHEEMPMNEKYKAVYTDRVNAMLLMGTNKPVKISDAKSGIIRRLIDVHPTGVKIPPDHYHVLISRVDFELGAIAHHCLETYRTMGKNYYSGYRPVEMMFQTDIFFNFIEAHFDIFKEQDGVTLQQAYALYKEWCSSTGIDKPLPQYKVRGELANYFEQFKDRMEVNGQLVRSYYYGFTANKFKEPAKDDNHAFRLVIEETVSLLDDLLATYPAQYAKEDGTPEKTWSRNNSYLTDLDTTKLHFVKIPENHIIIDFDLKDEDGNKSLERNLEAASVWPATYAELSKSGEGIHLHYIYDGDTDLLSNVYSEGIEVKVYRGNASLRRRLSRCNNIPVATISSGLPLKEKKMLSEQTVKSERHLRDMIARNLAKDFHPNTASSVSFIKKLLDEAYEKGIPYDVTDLRGRIVAFANNSSNQPLQCLKTVQQMKFRSDESVELAKGPEDWNNEAQEAKERLAEEAGFKQPRIAFYDVEVYPNLFVICWKFEGDASMVRMINPKPEEVEALFKLRLVGFNNRRYDNHILYAAFMGYNNLALYNLSQAIIDNKPNCLFGEAYNLSYADIYDFSSVKQSLKKFMIELGVSKMEMDIPWDKPVPPELVSKVVEYCSNDVNGTEATFNARKQDFMARLILCDLSGLTPNHTTQAHTAKIIFGDDRHPQAKFQYTLLKDEFPGYEFDHGKSSYRGEDPSEGGYVYEEIGIHENVAVLDVASMHPTSIIQLNLFGEYTPNFKDLLDARVAIKRKEFDRAKKMLGGKLAPYLGDPKEAKALSYALKIVINIVYGLTSAKFDNPFRDPRNKDNIVAKRGALFMIDLKNAVQAQGYQVVHIKTDSIKIPNADEHIIEFVNKFGDSYGYEFEHEATYDKFCLVDKAQYIARYGWHATEPEKVGTWEATGAKFQHPYVFKTLFSHEPIEFKDLCETKQVQKGHLYLDFDGLEKPMYEDGGLNKMRFIGRIGEFIPVVKEAGGGLLYRFQDEKFYAAAGTKGHFWLEADRAQLVKEDQLDMSYYDKLAEDAKKSIEKFGSFDEFVAA